MGTQLDVHAPCIDADTPPVDVVQMRGRAFWLREHLEAPRAKRRAKEVAADIETARSSKRQKNGVSGVDAAVHDAAADGAKAGAAAAAAPTAVEAKSRPAFVDAMDTTDKPNSAALAAEEATSLTPVRTASVRTIGHLCPDVA